MEKLIKPETANEWTIYHWVRDGKKGRSTNKQIEEINAKILHARRNEGTKKKKKMSYATFRSNALSGLTLVKKKRGSKKMSKTETDEWIEKEYKRHYG